MTRSTLPAVRRASRLTIGLLVLVGGLGAPLLAQTSSDADEQPPTSARDGAKPVPEVLAGDTWLRHHREELMPYWDMPEALGEPVGNFPSFRDRAGHLSPELITNRGLSTLARGVYGYSLAFLLTGEERYLGYASAGLDWIEANGMDPAHGGFFGELDVAGAPADPLAHKDVFDLASLGLAYGMYFNVTRDPAAEDNLLAVRDLLFDSYVDPATDRVMDSLTYDLATEVDTGGNGGDITNLLVPGTALLLPYVAILTDAPRRQQFRDDLRWVTQNLIDRHKNVDVPNQWWFWGRTDRFGRLNALQTDFGHNIKAYEMIHNANQIFPDRPWDDLAADRTILLTRAWDDAASRWNQRLRTFGANGTEPDSAWWIHNEADQTLAALNLSNGFSHVEQLARSAQTWLDLYVDRDPDHPVGETFARVERTGTMSDLRKSFFGKNMLHAHEHALIMYLHGRALEGLPATLHYAFPHDQALTAVAKPYWFDAAGQSRQISGAVDTLPGHVVTEVSFTGLDAVQREPFPAPDDTTPPNTAATITPPATADGWHRDDVVVELTATDDLVGVKEIQATVEETSGGAVARAWVDPGGTFTLPAITDEGTYLVRYFAVDALGNAAAPQSLSIRIDRTAPSVSGIPSTPCVVWPPTHRLVRVATVDAADGRSGVATWEVTASAPHADRRDIVIIHGRVYVRAELDPYGKTRTYEIAAVATDRAGNATDARGTCTVPGRRSP
jgi:mannose/cellobiose epimerase-like protein (N-acyl-D-glucosamine 2-epimerase family)